MGQSKSKSKSSSKSKAKHRITDNSHIVPKGCQWTCRECACGGNRMDERHCRECSRGRRKRTYAKHPDQYDGWTLADRDSKGNEKWVRERTE